MITISQIGVRNVVVLATHVEGPAPTRTEQLDAASKLGGEVEMGCVEHTPVEIKETTARSKKWLEAAIVHPVHLRSYRTATPAIGIATSSHLPGIPYKS